jgi:hypothetical protein
MTCKRCEDIHTAQKDGKTQEKCKCECHDDYASTITYNLATTSTNLDNNLFQFSNAGGAMNIELGETTISLLPNGNIVESWRINNAD